VEILISYRQFTKSGRFSRIKGLLAATHLTPKQAFEMTVQTLNQAIGGMEPGGKYKTEYLFEPSAWAGMGDAVKRCVGICLSYLTDDGLVPLVYASKPKANNKLYSLKPGVDPAGYSFRAC
jgi:hypothetical protein